MKKHRLKVKKGAGTIFPLNRVQCEDCKSSVWYTTTKIKGKRKLYTSNIKELRNGSNCDDIMVQKMIRRLIK